MANKKKDAIVSARIPLPLKQRLQEIAAQIGSTPSGLLARIVEHALPEVEQRVRQYGYLRNY